MFGSEYLISKLRAAVQDTLYDVNAVLAVTMDSDTAPIIGATKPRYKPNRIATIETVQILTAIMPEEEWKEIERRVVNV